MNLKRFFNRSAVVDASILFDFYELNSLYILNLVFSQLYIPAELVIEITRDDQLDEIKRRIDFKETVIETVKGYQLFSELGRTKKSLSLYDRHLICTAFEKGFMCASNDGLVVKVCRDLKIENPRTLGILGCATLHGIINQPEMEKLFFQLTSEECSSWLTLDDPVAREFAELFHLNLKTPWSVNNSV